MAVTKSTRYYFSPDTPFWRINSHVLVNLAGARALLLELAHPLVAAGVAEHSNYRGDPFGRLYRTMRTMNQIMFNDVEGSREGLRYFNRCHAKVKGELWEAVGPLPSRARYRAADPLLKLWVLATLYDSCLLVYDHFVAPLSLDDKRDYYRDGLLLGQLLGIPPDMMLATYDDFADYMATMINSNLLTVSDTARNIVEALFAPPLFGPFARTASFVGIGLLPQRIRNEFGFEWDTKREKRLHQLAALSRRVRPLLPHFVAANPQALIAERRIRLARN